MAGMSAIPPQRDTWAVFNSLIEIPQAGRIFSGAHSKPGLTATCPQFLH